MRSEGIASRAGTPTPAGGSSPRRERSIGIGAGVECDGQVLVLPDALGLNPGFSPRFLRRYAELARDATQGVEAYVADVKARRYPGPEHTFGEDS
jgi:3-methyl-2-oxobutanoate hydroxymethyltransferase